MLPFSSRLKPAPGNGAAAIPEQEGGEIAGEAAFLGALGRERRRTERSGRPFMLALVSGDGLRGKDSRVLVHAIASAICRCTRETDVLGWYEENVVFGVILTEIGEVDDSKLGFLVQKLAAAMQQGVPPDEFCRLRLEVRIFPHRWTDGGGKGCEPILYRDLQVLPGPRRREHLVKRVIDIVGSLLALLFLLPVFAIIAIVVKLTSRGPVLFRQKRIGQYGKMFDFYKFRSMRVGNDTTVHREYVTKLIDGLEHVRQANGNYKLMDDPRVTPIGRVLRKTSLDELPQFANVLLGDMSLVGPRPPLPYEFERYRTWHQRRVLEIKPGLTGLWQVEGRSRTTFDEMVRMDLRYARTQSLWLDLKIILQTPAAMFSGNGAT